MIACRSALLACDQPAISSSVRPQDVHHFLDASSAQILRHGDSVSVIPLLTIAPAIG
jgi:hypothetical protein